MVSIFESSIREAKFAYKEVEGTPSKTEFVKTFKSFYQSAVVTSPNEPRFSMKEAMSRARVVWADDIA